MIQNMKANNEQTKTIFWSAFWRSLVASCFTSSPNIAISRIELPKRSERDAMRGDWERIGMDFKNVIDRETTNHTKS